MVAAAATLPARSEVDDKYKWNAESVFIGADEWNAAAKELETLIPKTEAFKGRLAEGSGVLADFFDQAQSTVRLAERLAFYAAMRQQCDANDEEATAMLGRISGLYGQVMAAVSFLNPELIAIGRETLDKWIASEARLADYGQYVDNLFRQQAHVRSAEVEQVLGLASDPLGTANEVFNKLTNSDMKFSPATGSDGKEYPVSQSTIDAIYHEDDRQKRQTAYESYRSAYLEMKNTLAAAYLGSVRQDVFNMRVRGFKSSLESKLFADNIPVEVFHNLIDTYKRHLPVWHKYWRVRRKALGIEQIRPFDIWAPITRTPPKLSYEEAVDWISTGMAPLGDEYVNALRQGCLQDRWVDVIPTEGKSEGAFSYGTYDTAPFIMMSFDGGMSGLSTLAHELGHSMHSYLSNKNQPYINCNYNLFAAEVASNFNQALVRAYLREEKADDTQFQIALIEEAMDNIHRYFFIMPTLARFELEVHDRVEKGQGLTANDLITICAEFFGEGYGDEMTFDKDMAGITWATFGHLYSAFYTYQYATGISAAHELARGILNSEDGAVRRYLDFLSAGGSMYAMDALRHAGVDMTRPDAVETTFGVLADMVDRLESLIEQA